jgi:hypothetical protein
VATIVGLALAGPALAVEPTCKAAMAKVDTFGLQGWFNAYPPMHGRAMDMDCASECDFTDQTGVHYQYLDGQLTDKMLAAGTATPWPWGLDETDGPGEVKAKLARLLPGEGSMSVREGGPTYNLDIPGCDAWIEVTFAGERGIKAVSLNAQP